MSEILTQMIIDFIKENNSIEEIGDLRKEIHEAKTNREFNWFVMLMFKNTEKGLTNVFVIKETSLGNVIQSLQFYKNRIFTFRQVDWNEVEDEMDERIEELRG